MKMVDSGGRATTYTTVCKVLVTVLLVLWYCTMPAVGFNGFGGTIWGHVLWPLSHANVWHLAGNLWVLWWMKGRLDMREAYVMAVLCSFLPVLPGLWEMTGCGENAAEVHGALATCGFSGVLCAMVGVKWGEWMKGCGNAGAYRTFARRVLPFVGVGFLIPYINWSIHLYCLILGLAYGRWK